MKPARLFCFTFIALQLSGGLLPLYASTPQAVQASPIATPTPAPVPESTPQAPVAQQAPSQPQATTQQPVAMPTPVQDATIATKPEDIKIIPHRAEYTVELDRTRIAASQGMDDINDVRGTLAIQIADTGDGLAFEQHATIQVYYADGSMEQSITTVASWESEDGQQYRFNTRSLRNGVEEITRGYAMSQKGLIGSATFEEPYEFRFDLPIGTMFPLTHLKHIIFAAQHGEHGLPGKVVFDGSNGIQEPVEVNVVIGGAFDPKINPSNKPELLKVDKAWALQFAVFPLGSKTTEADFEMGQKVLPSGIITAMAMDLGQEGVPTKLTLSKVEILKS